MANTNKNKKYNSLSDQYAQQMRNNQNTLEVLTKLDQSLNSSDSFITMSHTDASGRSTTVQIPTIGYFRQRLEQISRALEILAGVDGNPSSVIFSDNKFKRIVVADLDLEPRPITSLEPITTFRQDPNWIFDSMMNPQISVEIDLTGKIAQDIRTIESKRFIVDFDKTVVLQPNGDEEVSLTELGQQRKREFEERYKGKSNVDMVEFVAWLDLPGLINRVDDTLLDKDYFRVEPNRLQYKGDFTVSGTESDTLNRKLWYVVDSLTYYDISDPLGTPKPIQLKVGDTVRVNPNEEGVRSTTVYKVVEISTITSQFRVRFELVYGQEPIPVRLSALSIYSGNVKRRSVKVSVGFDEYCVLFIRAVNDNANMIGQEWSPGVGMWTNELRLDSEAGETFSDFYIRKVYDYGLALEDLVQKKIPNYYGIKPRSPELDTENFKVVQINQHLTNSADAETLRDLHNNKNNVVSEIHQIQEAIDKQNRAIQTTVYRSQADRKRAEDELVLLEQKLKSKNANKFTIIQDILASKKNINKIPPKFRLRGFWAIPEAIRTSKTGPQEVVQFEVWYRKLSKSGSENPILTIQNLGNLAARTTQLNQGASGVKAEPRTVNGTFSNWNRFKTDARKMVFDEAKEEWVWEIEDVSDANTPNINQLDLDIEPGEKIEIKIKALSEVGWPEAPIESDFSETITIEFPDDLNNVLGEDEFILKEAQTEELKVNMERDLDARGLNLHLNSSFRIEDVYYAHRAEAIASGFKDEQGKIVNLYDHLLMMYNKVTALEEKINRAKGILEVYIVNKGNRIKLFNGNSMSYNINLEDYMTATKVGMAANPVENGPRTYVNELMQITDFSLLIRNGAAESNLGLLSNRGYGRPSGFTPSEFAYNGLNAQGISDRGIQAIWIQQDAKILFNDIPSNDGAAVTIAPKYATQQNNQWLWLQVKDLNGNFIYDSAAQQPSNNYFDEDNLDTFGQSYMHAVVTNKTYNFGWLTGTNNASQGTSNVPIHEITNTKFWQINESYTSGSSELDKSGNGGMGSVVCPVINGFNDVVDTSSQLLKLLPAGDTEAISIPIYLYVKPYTGTGVFSPELPNGNGNRKTQFHDVDDMPTIPTGVNNVESTTPTSSTISYLTVTFNSNLMESTNSKLVVGDKVIFTGFTGSLSSLNNVPLTVRDLLANNKVRFTHRVTLTPKQEEDLRLEQIHKRYKYAKTTDALSGKELVAYNVLGSDKYVDNYIQIETEAGNPTPMVHNKKLRFYLEDENNIRPFEFQINWEITQYKRVRMSLASFRDFQTVAGGFSGA